MTHETTTSPLTTTTFVFPSLPPLLPPPPPPKSPLRSSDISSSTQSPADNPISQAALSLRPSRQPTRTHRYASSDPGHSSVSTMSVVFPSQSSSPERSPTRMRTMPGYRTAHATHVRSFRERPTSLDAILESITGPQDGASAGPSKPNFDYIYTDLRVDDGEKIPFPRRTWAGENLDSRSTFALGSSTAELGNSANGEQRISKTNKLRKAPPRSKKVSERSARRPPVRRSSSRRSPTRKASPVRRSPSRRSPSPPKERLRAISFAWRRFRDGKRRESQASKVENPAPQVMEGYVVEPFVDSRELQGNRPLSYMSTTSVGADSFYTARGSVASPTLPPESRPMSMMSWDSTWDGARMSMGSRTG